MDLPSTLFLLLMCTLAQCITWQGTKHVNEGSKKIYSVFQNSMLKGSHVDVKILCQLSPGQTNGPVKIHWILQELECMEELYATENMQAKDNILSQLTLEQLRNETYLKPDHSILPRASVPRKGHLDSVEKIKVTGMRHPATSESASTKVIKFQVSATQAYNCEHNNILPLMDESSLPHYVGIFNPELPDNNPQRFSWTEKPSEWKKISQFSGHVATAWEDGMYHFMINVAPILDETQFNASIHVNMKSEKSYLPAIQWPLLPVRGVLAFLYLSLGTAWVLLWARSHQHTLRIHIIIGAVAVAAALANTLSFVELSAVSSTGNGILGMKWFSLFLSVLQNCLVHVVLMIVSTGYGISRPDLQRNMVASAMCLASFTAIANFLSLVVLDEELRIKYSWPNIALGVNIAFGVLMLILGGWIMIFSILTFIHLGRRKHATAKVGSFTVFTLASIIAFIVNLALVFAGLGLTKTCSKDWHLEWLFQSFGSMTTFLLLIVLMWLWRPVDQAQSYAFTPLNTDEAGLIDDGSEDEMELTIYDKAEQANEKMFYDT